MTDEQLIDKAKSGEDEAFQMIIEKHYKTVEKFAYQIGVRPENIEDVTQEVFLRVYRFLTKYTRGKFTTWLYTLTLNVTRDLIRKENSLRKKAERMQRETVDNAYHELAVDEEALELHSVIQQLEEKYRIPIVLHYFHDQSYKEIAVVLGVRESTIKTRMMRAKQMLKSSLEKGRMLYE
ncbi:RNA polymerase sigma factor [Anaerobacillus sp. MEB173]|uniref:RNA polymerase sigma factor n=1 Tax=Anaerobacillus sp. MEB173 TaxID=3383345 RepID=UPI003F9098D7